MSSNEEIKQNVTAIMILEAMGRPKEHIVEILEGLVDKISKEKGVELIEKKINEPTLVKDQKDLFSTYAEIEIKVETAFQLAILMFKYMPSHVDIVEPENFKMSSIQYNDILNELTRRLHKYDELMKVLQMERNVLANKVKKYEEESK